ncbi:MAG: hypothetical protein K0R14_613 [Burkholderiales bacterium]|nr:hypothetical protein [Burkholderiales bacterium]
MTYKEFDLFKAWQIVKDGKKIIAIGSGITTFIAIIYCIFATPIFTAKVIINPPKLTDPGIGLSQMLLGSSYVPNSNFSFDYTTKTDADTAIAMMRTNALMDMVVDKFNLTKLYKSKDREIVRGILYGRAQFISNIRSGFLEIYFDDSNPKLASDIVNFYVVALGQLISNVAHEKSRQRMQFFLSQMSSTKDEMIKAQDSLKTFAKANGIIAGQQLQAVAGLSIQLQAQLVSAKSQLQAMSLYATNNNPEYKSLQATINSLKAQLDKLSGQSNAVDQLPIPSGLAPGLAQQYQNLLGDALLREEIYKLVVKQYESAKIDVISEEVPEAIQVIDPAQVPIHKSKPRRLRIIFSSFVLGIFLSVVYLLFKNRKSLIIYHLNN